MKLTFDTSKILPFIPDGCYIENEDQKVSLLGRLLMAFLYVNEIHPSENGYVVRKDWIKVADTRRPLLVAVMGDSIYDHRPRWTHLRHMETQLDVLWHHDGDLSVVFHHEGNDGFTITNRNSSMNSWHRVSLEDPRNDPAYDPFA